MCRRFENVFGNANSERNVSSLYIDLFQTVTPLSVSENCSEICTIPCNPSTLVSQAGQRGVCGADIHKKKKERKCVMRHRKKGGRI